MPLSSAVETASLPSINDKTAFYAPRGSAGSVSTTGFQAFQFVSEAISRNQSLSDDREYGGESGFVDAPDPVTGDVSASGNLVTRLCLNQTAAFLGYALGAGTVSGTAPDFTHVFKSGKSELPVMDIIFETSGGRKTVDYGVLSGFTMAFGRAAEFQKIDLRVQAKDADFAASAALTGAASASARELLNKRSWRCLINDVEVGRLLSSSLDYNPDIQEDRYLNSELTADEFFVGEPTLTGEHRIRYSSAAALDIYDGEKTPFKLEFIGEAASGKTISILIPRAFAPRPSPRRDGTLLDYSVQWRAAKTEGATPAPAMTITVENTIGTF